MLSALRKLTHGPLLTLFLFTTASPSAWSDNCNAMRYNCLETFYKNQAIKANNSANAVRSNSSSSSNSSGSNDGLSSALAHSFAGLKARQDAEIAAGDARAKAWDEASRKAFVPFSGEDIADSRRKVLIIGANDGRASRQNQLGVALLNGELGFSVDADKGIYWLRKAAAQGDVHAARNLVEIVMEGQYGIKPDYVYGLQLFEVLVAASGMPEGEQAAMMMNQTIDIFKKDERFFASLAEAALKANALNVPEAPQVLYKLTMVSSPAPTPVDTKLKTLFESPLKDPYLVAASAFAMSNGFFGIPKDKKRGKEILQAQANLGHQAAIDILKVTDCFSKAKTPADQTACEPTVRPFYF
jgi:TPR repeat protein